MSDVLKPKDDRETTALFRAQVIGPLTARPLNRGELAEEIRQLTRIAVRPPHSAITRTYAASTIERWYYAFREHGLDGLRPKPRSDRGYAQELSEAQKRLLVDIAEEHNTANVAVIFRTLVAQGQIDPTLVSETTVRRFLAERGLDARSRRIRAKGTARRRWSAGAPGELWHADVCHGPTLKTETGSIPVRIHALFDDASRYVVAVDVFSTEREVDMLALLVKALRSHQPPDKLYLDNGSTYRGEVLATACGRLGIKLLHAQPYDPQARGKMERWWRTLREGCLDHLGPAASLHDVRVRVLAFVDQHYHPNPHSSLFGKTPEMVYRPEMRTLVPEARLRDALTVRAPRRVERDGTFSLGGVTWEVEAGFLAGKKVTVARTLFEPKLAPWIEHEERTYVVHRVDPVANGRRPRPKTPARGIDAPPFDPAGALLDRMLDRGRDGGAR